MKRWFLIIPVLALVPVFVIVAQAQAQAQGQEQSHKSNVLSPDDGAKKESSMQVTAYEPEYEALSFTDDSGDTHVFKVEPVQDLAAIQKGLMFRRELAADHGMLFIFPNEAERGFWMKNTYIPLDMFFIKKDGTIHKIHKGAVPQDITIIRSNGAVQYVLEANEGTADRYGIEAGDQFHHKIFVNKLAE